MRFLPKWCWVYTNIKYMSQRFQRTIEDFTCGHCGRHIKGNGYTNHCPSCLWSKHVDVHPGDRAALCGGMMEPIALSLRGDGRIITHRCLECGHKKNNLVSAQDDRDAVVALSAIPS